GLLPETSLKALAPSAVSPAIAVLVSEEAPNKMIICAGAGSFEAAHITLTQGIHLGTGDEVVHNLVQHLSELTDRTNEIVPT
ncbi:3-hydroxyacyl-CoA dehydrogenase, partial [Acinetobacter baumannii]